MFISLGIYLGSSKYLYVLPPEILESLIFWSPSLFLHCPPTPSPASDLHSPSVPPSAYFMSSVALRVPTSSRPHPPVSWSPWLSWSLHISFQMGDGLAPSFLSFPLLLDVETSAAVNAVSRYCASWAVPERVIKLLVFNNFISTDLTLWYGFYRYLCRLSLSFLGRFRYMFLQCHYSALSAVWCLSTVFCTFPANMKSLTCSVQFVSVSRVCSLPAHISRVSWTLHTHIRNRQGLC